MIDKWRIEENVFSEKTSGKHETLMTLGNGYMGIRAGFEEEYAGQKRGFFIAGTYNRAGLNEVAELPNAADITAFEIIIDTLVQYNSELNGILKRFYNENINV